MSINEATAVPLGLADEFAVLQLERIDADTVKIVIEVIDPGGPLSPLRSAHLKGQGTACGAGQGRARLGPTDRAVGA